MWPHCKDDLPKTVPTQDSTYASRFFSGTQARAYVWRGTHTLLPRAKSHVRVASHAFHMSPRGPNFNSKTLEICENYPKGWVEIQPLCSVK